MSKYKILKDFPVFTTGNKVFGNIEVGEEGFVPANDFVAEKLIEAGYIEPIEKNKRCRVESGRKYWYVDDFGYASIDCEHFINDDDYRYNTGNYFRTEAEAKAKRDYDLSLQVIKDDAKGFVPDWTDGEQDKWYGHYDYIANQFGYDNDSSCYQMPSMIYFATDDDVKHSQKIHKKEWEIVRDYGKEEK